MATKVSEVLFAVFPELRYQPTTKRVRAGIDGSPVVDTQDALLVWEPKRVTPVYAVPEKDLLARLGAPNRRTAPSRNTRLPGHPAGRQGWIRGQGSGGTPPRVRSSTS